MKLCQFCNEFACGQSGTKAISEHCGDKNMKISEYIMDLVEKDIKHLEEKKC